MVAHLVFALMLQTNMIWVDTTKYSVVKKTGQKLGMIVYCGHRSFSGALETFTQGIKLVAYVFSTAGII